MNNPFTSVGYVRLHLKVYRDQLEFSLQNVDKTIVMQVMQIKRVTSI